MAEALAVALYEWRHGGMRVATVQEWSAWTRAYKGLGTVEDLGAVVAANSRAKEEAAA